jgi:hypothetical protein
MPAGSPALKDTDNKKADPACSTRNYRQPDAGLLAPRLDSAIGHRLALTLSLALALAKILVIRL